MLRKIVIILIVVSLFPLPVLASDSFTRNEIMKEFAYAIISGLDAGQTKRIAHTPGHREANPYLRKHSSNKEINEYFLSMAIGHVVISKYLSRKNRQLFQDVTLIIGVTNISRNFMLGTEINF